MRSPLLAAPTWRTPHAPVYAPTPLRSTRFSRKPPSLRVALSSCVIGGKRAVVTGFMLLGTNSKISFVTPDRMAPVWFSANLTALAQGQPLVAVTLYSDYAYVHALSDSGSHIREKERRPGRTPKRFATAEHLHCCSLNGPLPSIPPMGIPSLGQIGWPV